jgi:uncharacterized protein YceK
MKKLMLGITVLLAVFLSGCATDMSERASHVQIIDQTQANQYQFVANVTGTSSLTGVSRQTGYQNAINEALDKAAEAGAKYVVIDPKSSPSYWATSQVVRATAYKNK